MHKGHTLKSYRSVSSLYWNAVFVRLPVLTPLTKSDLLHEFNSWKLTHQEWIISQRRNNCILFVFIRLKHFSTYLKFLLICPLEHESAKHKTQQQKPTTVTFYGSLHYVAMRCEVFNIRGFHNWRAYHYPLCIITCASPTNLWQKTRRSKIYLLIVLYINNYLSVMLKVHTATSQIWQWIPFCDKVRKSVQTQLHMKAEWLNKTLTPCHKDLYHPLNGKTLKK